MSFGPQYKATTIEEYLSNIEPTHRTAMQDIVKLTKKLVSEAKEGISYGMPTFKYKNQPLIHFVVYKKHISFIPAGNPIKVLEDRLKDYKHTKTSIQFPLDTPLPVELITDLINLRVKDINKGVETHKSLEENS